MVSGGAGTVLLVGVVAGATLAGGIIGAGIDFVTGNQGWWGVCALSGLMIGGIACARIAEGRSQA
jgi:hypothetical protein